MKLYTAIQARLNSMRNEDGATAVEYGLVVSLIAIVAIAGFTAVGVALNGTFDDIGKAL